MTNRILYHGTTLKNALSIVANGFDMSLAGSKSNAALPGISTTIEKEVAIDHANWAVKKFKGKPAIVACESGNLKILSGNRYMTLWDSLGSSDAALEKAKSSNYDGAEMFDLESGEGIEEYEVLLFHPEKCNWFIASS